MCEKCILLRKAQAVGEAKERIFDNHNRRTGTKSKGSKRPTEAMVVKKESPVSKLMGKASRVVKNPATRKVTEVFPMKGMPAKVPPMKSMPAKVSAEVPPMPTSMSAKMPAVASPMPTSMSTKMSAEVPPMPTKSLDVSRWRKANKASRDTDSNKPFHIPLLCVTPGRDNPWRFEVEQPLFRQPPACFHPYSSFLIP